MENALIYSTNLGGKVITSVTYKEEDEVVFTFNDGATLELSTFTRDGSRPVVVSADTSIFTYYEKDLIGLRVNEVEIKGVEKTGYLVCFNDNLNNSYRSVRKILVNCYNEDKHWFYSDELMLNIQCMDDYTEADIAEMTSFGGTRASRSNVC